MSKSIYQQNITDLQISPLGGPTPWQKSFFPMPINLGRRPVESRINFMDEIIMKLKCFFFWVIEWILLQNSPNEAWDTQEKVQKKITWKPYTKYYLLYLMNNFHLLFYPFIKLIKIIYPALGLSVGEEINGSIHPSYALL